jgi:hypothetical protein
MGGQIGYNWPAGSWLFGLEAYGNRVDLHRSYCGPVGAWYVVGREACDQDTPAEKLASSSRGCI